MKTPGRKKRQFRALVEEVRTNPSRGTFLVATSTIDTVLKGAIIFNFVALFKAGKTVTEVAVSLAIVRGSVYRAIEAAGLKQGAKAS
jgi:hypothetical protein